MSIRRNLISYLALFSALGGTSYAATQPARVQRTCNPKGSTTIAQDAVGRFYSLSAPGHSDFRRLWWYCVFSQRRPHHLKYHNRGAPPPYAHGPAPADSTATMSSSYLAFVTFTSPFGTGPRIRNVVVIDMVAGRQTFTDPIYTAGEQCRCPGAALFPRLVLEPNGSVAWISNGGFSPGPSYVHRHDSTGTAVVDSGPQIDPNSLAAGGSWLYWTNAGSPRSAPFH